MPQNLVSQTMTDAQRDALLADLASFDTKFTPFKVALTPEQIGRLGKSRRLNAISKLSVVREKMRRILKD